MQLKILERPHSLAKSSTVMRFGGKKEFKNQETNGLMAMELSDLLL